MQKLPTNSIYLDLSPYFTIQLSLIKYKKKTVKLKQFTPMNKSVIILETTSKNLYF